jgi:hypothetical protein
MKQTVAPQFDFAARRGSGSAGGWLLLAVGVVCAAAVGIDGFAVREEVAHWQGKTEYWQRLAQQVGRRGNGVAGGDVALLRPQAEAAAGAITRLSVPWNALYRSLEDSVDDSVSLLSVLTSLEKDEVRLNGEAKDFDALGSYLRRLNDSGSFSDARLLGHQVRQSDAQKPVVFSIAAHWRRPS